MSAVATAGKLIFSQNCGVCQGLDRRDANGPHLVHSTTLSHDVNGNLIGEVIRSGRPDKGMLAFQLPDEQVHQMPNFFTQLKLTGGAEEIRSSDEGVEVTTTWSRASSA